MHSWNHCHSQAPEYFITTHFVTPPSPATTEPLPVSVCRFAFSRILCKGSHHTWCTLVWLLLSVMVLRCIQIAGCSVACFFCCPVVSHDVQAGGHSGCFWFSAIMGKGSKNIRDRSFLLRNLEVWDCWVLWQVCLNFLRNCQMLFQNGHTVLQSQRSVRTHLLHTLSSTGCLLSVVPFQPF